MQKYYIANGDGKGKKYIQKKGNSFVITTYLKATEFGLQYAIKIIKDGKLPSSFTKYCHIEGVEDNKKISLDEILNKKETPKDDKTSLMDEIASFENLFSNLSTMCKQIPNKNRCITINNRYNEELSRIDLELTDINHWIEDNSPPAHIRCQVFTREKDLREKRRKIKQTMNYLSGLLEWYDSGKTLNFSDFDSLMENYKYKGYKPRTDTYKELDDLLKSKKGVCV